MDCNGPSNVAVQRAWAHNMQMAVERAISASRKKTMNQARATSFSTLKDLRAYIKCRDDDGGSPDHCLSFGDNGVGAWGDTMAQLKVPYVALPHGIGVHNKHLRVVLNGMGHGLPFECICGDISPAGVIDLCPAALVAAGLPSDTELDCPAEWDWV